MFSSIGIESLLTTVISVVLVMVSASVHEFGHAMAAHLLGDDTAKRQGRLTLNPLAHIDTFGSLILPLLMGIMGGPIFAFAKPVPYNPNNLRNKRRDEVLVALAGPATNLLQALLGAIIFRILWWLSPETAIGIDAAWWLYRIAALYTYVNLVLCFFNLIPLPPLDGSAIITPLLPDEALEKYYVVQRYSLPILITVLYLVPMVLRFDPLGAYIDFTAGNLSSLLLDW